MTSKSTGKRPSVAAPARESARARARARPRPARAKRPTTTRSGAATNPWTTLPAPVRSVITGLLIVTGSGAAGVALMTASRHSGVGAVFGGAMVMLLGWGAYPLTAGLLCGGLTRVAEGVLRRPLMRRALPLQGFALWLLLLGWSRLLRGGHTGGLVGAWVSHLFNGLPWRLGIVVAPVFALVLVFAIIGITWGQIANAIKHAASLAADAAASGVRGRLAPRSPAAAVESGAAPIAAPIAPPRQQGQAAQPAFQEVPALPAHPAIDRAAVADLLVPSAGQVAPKPTRATADAMVPARDGAQPFAVANDPSHEWALPSQSLFEPAASGMTLEEDRAIEAMADRLERTLRALRVDAEVRREDISIGPMVARFGIRPLERKQRDHSGRPELDADGEPLLVRTRVSRILALQPDLALALQVPSLRMEAPVPGQPYVGVEVPNPGARPVGLREVLWSESARRAGRQRGVMIALGRDTAGHARVGDLTQFPHALIAGATGSGKSVCLHSIICSLLSTRTPTDLRLLLIDPKLVELSIYEGVPHLLLPVLTDVDAAEEALERAIAEMRRRFALFSRVGVRNLDSYRRMRERQPELEPLPWIVIVVDEVANLMLAGDGRAEELLCTLAQLARAAGIHLVIATQRPSVDVVTGTIKANFPARLAFAMASSVDSRTILDTGGAEHLLGRGDMLFVGGERARPERIQGCRVLDDEIERVVAHWAAQSQPSRQRHRTYYEGGAWPPLAERTARPSYLDTDDTIEARQAGGRTRWGWSVSTEPVDFDEWR